MIQEKNERRSSRGAKGPARPGTAMRHQGLRESLSDAAERLIETGGLASLRARDLAEAAGCSVGAIYNVCADLDELILEVNARTLHAMSQKMQSIESDDPIRRLTGMANAYLTYAAENRVRWDALFSHRLPAGASTPAWFEDVLDAAFSHIEAPLGVLCPDLTKSARHLLARSIFAAVHGMVALGLDKRLAPIDLAILRSQIRLVVSATIDGLPTIYASPGRGRK
jgi:AcrR family transcriptional regulator